MEEMNRWYGCLHGYERMWDEQGTLRAEALGELGIRITAKRWDEQGRLVRDWALSPKDDEYKYLLLARKRWGHLAPPIFSRPFP
jgi:hypothetical protein